MTKISKSAPTVQLKAAGNTFFRKAGDGHFFGAKESPAFFNKPVQAKLTVSSPDDAHEKEADAVADKVMRMPAPVMAAPATEKQDEKLQRKEKEEEEVQAKQQVPVINKIQCKETAGIKLQAKLSAGISKSAEKQVDTKQQSWAESNSSNINADNVSRRHQSLMRQSERGPPVTSTPFEQTLSSSKGSGSALPGATRTFMESRFSADFSGVRIHTDNTAQQLSSSINAQAFAHGNDIYFNSGKFSPDSTEGGTLLAHELTHTIQQGASKTINPSPINNTTLARQKIISGNTSPSNEVKSASKETKTNGNKDFNLLNKQEAGSVKVNVEAKAVQKQQIIAPKPVLSNWNVTANGNLHSKAVKVTDKAGTGKDMQMKEEGKEEKETLPAGIENKIHKKSTGEINAESAEKINQDFHSTPAQPIHRLPLVSKGQVLTNEAAFTNPTYVVNERGPPVRRMSSGSGVVVIQRSLFDSALGHIGEFLSDIPITLSLDVAKNWLMNGVRRFASYIPGYRALGVVLGHDPITGQEIARNGRNFIEAALDIIPGGNLIRQKLDELGLIDRAATWIDTQIAALTGIVQGVRDEFIAAWNALGISSILDGPMNILRNFGGILERAINNIISFARRAATELIDIVKKFLLTQVVNFVKQHTNAYDLLKVILGKDPITDVPVERNGTNILNALLEMGGDAGREQKRQMLESHTFERAAGWIDRGISVFGDLYTAIRSGFSRIWDMVSIQALMHPVDTFNQIYEIFAAPVRRVLDFVRDALIAIIGFIKEALMTRLSAWARTVRGYPLITVIIGKDPFTNATVPRTVENIIHGFMSLMEGGEEQFNQMKESGAIARATQRINAAVARLNMTPEYIVQLFTALWNSFSFADLAHPVEAFQRILARFGEPIGRLIAFVIEIIRIVIEVILQVMNFPSDLVANIIAKAMLAFEMIKRNPVGFLKNLLRAIKQGFIQFFDNILRHLLAGLQGWLMSELRDSGVQAPADFTLRGIIGWVLQILNITMEKIWEKLAQHPRIGPQRVARIRGMIDRLEGIWTFIKDVQQRGMAAIWDKIQEQLSNLWNVVLDSIKNWIMEQIINRVVTRMLSMLDPTGIMAVINSVIALYRAVQSFVRYLRQMLEIVNSFVEGVVQIASGNITVAANFLERSLARGIPVMIGFLANQVGLSGVGRRISQMIETVRGLVDRALTWLVNRAVNMGMNFLDRVMALGRSAVGAVMGALRNLLGLNKDFTASDGQNHRLYYVQQGDRMILTMASIPIPITTFLASAGSAITAMTGGNKNRLERVHRSASDTHLSMQENETRLGREEDRGRQNSLQRTIQTQMNSLSTNMAELAPVVGAAYPPAVIPPMINGVKARGFTAEYISTVVPDGTEASSYDGRTLGGWGLLVGAGMHVGTNNYVKMHLLPHRLGGDAKDSNLTPALGQLVNLVFSRNLEVHAIAAKDAGETIWYRVTIQYHTGTVGINFPRFIQSEWGRYRRQGTTYEKVPDPTHPRYSDSPSLPAITHAMLINTAEPRMLADFLRINLMLANLIVRLRNRLGNHPSLTILMNRLQTNTTNRDKSLVGDFDAQLEVLQSRLENYNSRITY